MSSKKESKTENLESQDFVKPTAKQIDPFADSEESEIIAPVKRN